VVGDAGSSMRRKTFCDEILTTKEQPGDFVMTQKYVALFGRGDAPTDALREYCAFLGEALSTHGYEMEMHAVGWAESGWAAALWELRREAQNWRDVPVFLQYTALAWSARGFPGRVLWVIETLRAAGALVGVVFHDVEPYGGSRMIDRLRRRAQLQAMRAILRQADMAIFTVALDHVSWKPEARGGVVFIPDGANFSDAAVSLEMNRGAREAAAGRTMAVYGVTGGENGRSEIRTIIGTVRDAAKTIAGLRLVVLGRNSELAEQEFREGLRDSGVELQVLGVLPPERVAFELMRADTLLFVRGEISTRRGSAIAGISSGLPVICFAGAETATPITEAGLALYAPETAGDLSRVLLTVLSDARLRKELAEKSRIAFEKYFSWKAIAARYAEVLSLDSKR
jgi:glycosyltransferase involved in cell wall biosynthesis